MYTNVPSQLWMLLDKPIRTHLATVFEIPMNGIREIIDDRVISDGYSNKDLEAITLEKMIAYIGSEETFPRAWELTCLKAKEEINPHVRQMADEPKETPSLDVTTITSENMVELQNKTKTNDSTKKESKQK